MKQLDFSKCLAVGTYCTPTVELCEVYAEKGYSLSFGEAGAAGTITEGETYEF